MMSLRPLTRTSTCEEGCEGQCTGYDTVSDYRPLRDDEVLPVRRHRVVAGAATSLKGEEPAEKEEVS